MSERKPCEKFVRQWPVGNGEWINTDGRVCPRCGFMESEHPHTGEPADESAPKSRSVLRREAALRGEAAPTFETPKPVLRPDPWKVMEEAVSEGIAYGLNRADKHADDVLTDAQRQRVTTAVYEAVMLEMSERFMWDDEV